MENSTLFPTIWGEMALSQLDPAKAYPLSAQFGSVSRLWTEHRSPTNPIGNLVVLPSVSTGPKELDTILERT